MSQCNLNCKITPRVLRALARQKYRGPPSIKHVKPGRSLFWETCTKMSALNAWMRWRCHSQAKIATSQLLFSVLLSTGAPRMLKCLGMAEQGLRQRSTCTSGRQMQALQ